MEKFMKKKLFKKFIVMALVFVFALSAAACGNNKNDTKEPDNSEQLNGNDSSDSNDLSGTSDIQNPAASDDDTDLNDGEVQTYRGYGSDWDTDEWTTITDRYDTHTSWYIDYYNNDRYLIHVWGETEDGENVDFYHFEEERTGTAQFELKNGRYSIVTMMSNYGPINASISTYGDAYVEGITDYDDAVFNVVLTDTQLLTDLTREGHYFSASTETDDNGRESLRGLYLPLTYLDFPKHNVETISLDEMSQEDVDDINSQIADIIEKNDGSISSDSLGKIQNVLDTFNKEWETGSSYYVS